MNTGFIILFCTVIVFCAIVWISRKFGDDDETDAGSGGGGTDHDKPAGHESDKEDDQALLKD